MFKSTFVGADIIRPFYLVKNNYLVIAPQAYFLACWGKYAKNDT